MTLPVFYSFRRCPYAIRARLALIASGRPVELREVVLRDKPAEFLCASPSATVPCLVTDFGTFDESFDVMTWALGQNDPEGWLDMPEEGAALVAKADGPFKDALDHTKYHTRYPDLDPEVQRAIAHQFLWDLDKRLNGQNWLFGGTPKLADMAILPFVRQFAFIDKSRFDAEGWKHLSQWLEAFLASQIFRLAMPKFPQWRRGDAPVQFP